MGITIDPQDPRLTRGVDDKPVEQAQAYLVLSSEECAKGFVRPLRDSYVHVGKKSKYPLRDLTEEEKVRYAQWGYVKFEAYPESESFVTGRFWTQKDLDNLGCGVLTKMGSALAETYARNPAFYGATYCVGCRMHRPVEEFVWDGTSERVGS